ncbi:unnamed protein product [Durusdinium trenchii]|uniref:SH3 domain-containing protein n=2 Tax=Durusdinium trenchii TaxID=1381693 RepID=A0ABP0SNN3_9DINO
MVRSASRSGWSIFHVVLAMLLSFELKAFVGPIRSGRSSGQPLGAVAGSRGAPPPGFSDAFGSAERFEGYQPLDRSGFGDGPVPTATRAWFYALTNIRIREKADVSSRALGTVIRQGETFEVDAELVVTGQKYLKLAKQPGWVFTRGLSGDWKGREIAKRSP